MKRLLFNNLLAQPSRPRIKKAKIWKNALFRFPFEELLLDMQRVIALVWCSPRTRIALSLTSRFWHLNVGLDLNIVSPHTLLKWHMDETDTYEDSMHYAICYCSPVSENKLRKMRMYFFCVQSLLSGPPAERLKVLKDIGRFIAFTYIPRFSHICVETCGLGAPLPDHGKLLDFFPFDALEWDIYLQGLKRLMDDVRAHSAYTRSILDWYERTWMQRGQLYAQVIERRSREYNWCLRIDRPDATDHKTWRLVVV